jgi:hypothetical protein
MKKLYLSRITIFSSLLGLFLSASVSPPGFAQLETKQESPAAGGGLSDEFDGEDLSAHWQVLNPAPDSFIVDGGALVIVSGVFGTPNEDSVQNVFKLSSPPPDGDWVATIRLKLDAQTAKEQFYLLLHDDAQNYVGVSLYTWFECCGYNAVAEVQPIKRSGGQDSVFNRRVWRSETASGVFSESARSLPAFILKLEKRGHSFYPAIRLEDTGSSEWVELERLVSLRAKGHLAFALRQYEEVSGESIATVDWVRLEPLP